MKNAIDALVRVDHRDSGRRLVHAARHLERRDEVRGQVEPSKNKLPEKRALTSVRTIPGCFWKKSQSAGQHSSGAMRCSASTAQGLTMATAQPPSRGYSSPAASA